MPAVQVYEGAGSRCEHLLSLSCTMARLEQVDGRTHLAMAFRDRKTIVKLLTWLGQLDWPMVRLAVTTPGDSFVVEGMVEVKRWDDRRINICRLELSP
jgi:hypothetical protein